LRICGVLAILLSTGDYFSGLSTIVNVDGMEADFPIRALGFAISTKLSDADDKDISAVLCARNLIPTTALPWWNAFIHLEGLGSRPILFEGSVPDQASPFS
jgi:hypothetical protein